MRYFLVKKIYLIPPTLVGLSFLSHFISFDLFLIGNIAGYSLATTTVMIAYFWGKGNFCMFTKLCTIALFLMSLSTLTFSFLNYETAGFIFDVVVIILTLLLTIFLFYFNKR